MWMKIQIDEWIWLFLVVGSNSVIMNADLVAP
jgi:hypothetical protein